MRDKIRVLISIFCVVAIVLVAFAGCSLNGETATEGEKDNQKIEQTVAEEKPYDIGYDVVNVGDVSVISDYSGIRIFNEVSGEETLVFEGEADTMAFNGETLYFFTLDCKDETFETYYVDEETGEREPAGEIWEYNKLYSYSLATSELNEVFDGNSYRSTLIHIDDNYIYFTDLKDELVGDITMMLDYNREHFYKYDINSGKKTTVLEDIGEIEYVDGNFIYQSERHLNGDRGFHPTRIYNIESCKSYDIDQCAKFIYADDERIYFVTQEEKEFNVDFDYESCSFTGTDKELVSKLDFLSEESEYGAYLEGDEIILANWVGEGASFTYNIKTGKVKDCNLEGLYNNDDEETVLKETANGYYIGKYNDETYTVIFNKGEVKK